MARTFSDFGNDGGSRTTGVLQRSSDKIKQVKKCVVWARLYGECTNSRFKENSLAKGGRNNLDWRSSDTSIVLQ